MFLREKPGSISEQTARLTAVKLSSSQHTSGISLLAQFAMRRLMFITIGLARVTGTV
jgi:hypothetical protein